MPLFLRLPAAWTLAACLSFSGGVRTLAADNAAPPAAAAAKTTAPEKKTAKAAAKLPPKKQLTAEQTALRDRIRQTLAGHGKQSFNTRESSPADILKFCRALGCQTEIYHGEDADQRINGITALCWDIPCGGRQLLFIDDGRIAARVGYGLQERPCELLAMLALSCVPPDYPLRVGKTVRTVADLVEHEKLTCRAGTDLSLKLTALSYYVDADAWKNDLGEPWSLRHIIREELSRSSLSGQQEIARLVGLSCALARCQKRKLPVRGRVRLGEDVRRRFSRLCVSHAGQRWKLGPSAPARPVRRARLLVAASRHRPGRRVACRESAGIAAGRGRHGQGNRLPQLGARHAAATMEPAGLGQPRPHGDDFRPARLVALRHAGVQAGRRGETPGRGEGEGGEACRRGAVRGYILTRHRLWVPLSLRERVGVRGTRWRSRLPALYRSFRSTPE